MLRPQGFVLVTMYDEFGEAESRIADPGYWCHLPVRIGGGRERKARHLLICRSLDVHFGLAFSASCRQMTPLPDPVMIHDCGLKNRVLLTGDQQLVHTWAKEIADAKIAVFVVTDNNEGPKKWGRRIIAARRDIIRELHRRTKPFTARISSEGRVTQVRFYDGKQWNAVSISKKNPPHVNKYSKTEP